MCTEKYPKKRKIEGLNQLKDISYSWTERHSIVKMSIFY